MTNTRRRDAMKAASTAAGTGVAALTGKGQRTKRRVDTDKTSNIQYFRTDNKKPPGRVCDKSGIV